MYNYIFFKGYQLANRLKDWNDTPILFATLALGVCFILHFASVLMLLEIALRSKNEFSSAIAVMNKLRFFVGLGVVVIFYLYYSTKSRGKLIFDNYNAKEANSRFKPNPIVVLIGFYVLSFLLCMIIAMYKNQDGIFG